MNGQAEQITPVDVLLMDDGERLALALKALAGQKREIGRYRMIIKELQGCLKGQKRRLENAGVEAGKLNARAEQSEALRERLAATERRVSELLAELDQARASLRRAQRDVHAANGRASGMQAAINKAEADARDWRALCKQACAERDAWRAQAEPPVEADPVSVLWEHLRFDWAAMDKDGRWAEYETEPYCIPGAESWQPQTTARWRWTNFASAPQGADWTKTLRYRPQVGEDRLPTEGKA